MTASMINVELRVASSTPPVWDHSKVLHFHIALSLSGFRTPCRLACGCCRFSPILAGRKPDKPWEEVCVLGNLGL